MMATFSHQKVEQGEFPVISAAIQAIKPERCCNPPGIFLLFPSAIYASLLSAYPFNLSLLSWHLLQILRCKDKGKIPPKLSHHISLFIEPDKLQPWRNRPVSAAGAAMAEAVQADLTTAIPQTPSHRLPRP